MIGDVSSITDFNTNQTILLFHQDKTAALKSESVLNKNSGAEEIISFCTRPIAELWNVLDGTEEYLGEKKIEGRRVSGFRIIREDHNFKYNIDIWADYKSGFPFMVETTAKHFNESYTTLIWTMEKFNLDVELNEELFSLELLPGYTWAYQENTEDMDAQNEPSIEAQKLIKMLELASEDKFDKAIEVLLQIDWTKPMEFGKEPYVFSISEKGYISLKAEEQNRILEDIHASLTKLRKITFAIIDTGQNAVSDKQYDKAEKYFDTGLQLGKLLEQNQNSMLITQLVGIAIEKRTLNAMIEFYTAIEDNEKLREAQKQLIDMEAIGENIKKQASEMSK
jgi:hypothetical protein